METTLHSILKKAKKYIEDSIADKKIPTFTKKPIIGGNPAIENRTIEKYKASILFDLANKVKSAKSLFCFKTNLFRNRVVKKIDQTERLEIV